MGLSTLSESGAMAPALLAFPAGREPGVRLGPDSGRTCAASEPRRCHLGFQQKADFGSWVNSTPKGLLLVCFHELLAFHPR